MVRYVAILLSFMQCVGGFLMALKNFDYWCSVVFNRLGKKNIFIDIL